MVCSLSVTFVNFSVIQVIFWLHFFSLYFNDIHCIEKWLLIKQYAKTLNKDRVAFFIGHLYFHIAWQTDVRMFLGKTIVCSLNTFSIKFIQRSFGMEFYINRERKLKLAIDSTLCSYDNKSYFLPLLQKQPPEVFCKK